MFMRDVDQHIGWVTTHRMLMDSDSAASNLLKRGGGHSPDFVDLGLFDRPDLDGGDSDCLKQVGRQVNCIHRVQFLTEGLSELASMSNTSQSRLTHRLRDLVASGDVKIAPCPHDGRAKNATLTASGQKRLDVISPQHAEDVQRLFFDHLDEEQTKALADALSAIAASFSDNERFKPKN